MFGSPLSFVPVTRALVPDCRMFTWNSAGPKVGAMLTGSSGMTKTHGFFVQQSGSLQRENEYVRPSSSARFTAESVTVSPTATSRRQLLRLPAPPPKSSHPSRTPAFDELMLTLPGPYGTT